MKLLLTSAGLSTEAILNALLKMTSKEFSELKVAFIPNAADNYDDKWFVNKDRDQLKKKGFIVKEVDIREKTKQDLLVELGDCDIIFVAGGNTFYLLQEMMKSGADEIIKELVEKGIIYIGSSAGSVLVGPSIEPVKTYDDPSEAPLLKSFEGLNLVDFVVLPHFENDKYDEKYEDIMKKYNGEYKLISITDEQAIAVDGNSLQII